MESLSFAINKDFNQIISNQSFFNHIIYKNLDQNSFKSKIGYRHLVAFSSKKMNLIKTWYKTNNQEHLAIVNIFKT